MEVSAAAIVPGEFSGKWRLDGADVRKRVNDFCGGTQPKSGRKSAGRIKGEVWGEILDSGGRNGKKRVKVGKSVKIRDIHAFWLAV